MKKTIILSLLLILSTPLVTMAKDLCESLEGKNISIHANGYVGTIGFKNEGFVLYPSGNNTYLFSGRAYFEGETIDKVTGHCKDRRIHFTRTRPGEFVQGYSGWLFDRYKDNEFPYMAGTFSHNGENKWSWYAQVTLPEPR